jgi:hypothetical protein
MSELRDLRAKVTVETDAALDAEHEATGEDRSEIVRRILHGWAAQRIVSATVLLRKLKAEGVGVSGEGGRGSAAA